MGGELWCGQAQNGVNLDFQVKFDLEGEGQSVHKTIGTLTKVFWSKFGDPSLKVSRVIVRTSKWLTHTDRHTHTDAGNNNTRRPKLASGKNTKWSPRGNFEFDTIKTRQIWGIWKLRPAYSPETPNLGQNWWCFVPCDLEIWWMTLQNNRASLLCCFKLCATFHSHWWIQTGVTVRKRPIWVKFDDF